MKAATTAPWNDTLFKVNDTVKKLNEKRKATVHTFVIKYMFLCKRGRPDIELVVSYLSTRLSKPDKSDWLKLLRMLGFLKGTRPDILKMENDDSQVLSW